jgi:hypothetical protein
MSTAFLALSNSAATLGFTFPPVEGSSGAAGVRFLWSIKEVAAKHLPEGLPQDKVIPCRRKGWVVGWGEAEMLACIKCRLHPCLYCMVLACYSLASICPALTAKESRSAVLLYEFMHWDCWGVPKLVALHVCVSQSLQLTYHSLLLHRS